VAALGFTVLSLLLAAQVTGELYRVTEWALHHYQRERTTTQELFESQELLERTLRRSQSLSERVQEANHQLEEAKHFRGQFLANMSHELRTPLNAILGFSETMLKFPMMYDDIELPVGYYDDLAQIYQSGQQLLVVINDILDLSKVDAGKLDIAMDAVALYPMIERVLATTSGLIGNRPIVLETDLPDPLPQVQADESRLQQVLLNLCSNAAKYTEKGTVKLSVLTVDESVRISVTDTGSGVAPEYLESIFEEFKQAGSDNKRDPRSGAGLGLAISRQLVTLMNGQIWAESEVGQGSTFHVLLKPAAATINEIDVEPIVPDSEAAVHE
jgi:signal transduction histidine kinase